MKKVLSICFLVLGLMSCKNEKQLREDSRIETLVIKTNNLIHQLNEADSMKKVLIKAAFAAGYKKGVSTGINNSSASIPDLHLMASADSLAFSKMVDMSFK